MIELTRVESARNAALGVTGVSAVMTHSAVGIAKQDPFKN